MLAAHLVCYFALWRLSTAYNTYRILHFPRHNQFSTYSNPCVSSSFRKDSRCMTTLSMNNVQGFNSRNSEIKLDTSKNISSQTPSTQTNVETFASSSAIVKSNDKNYQKPPQFNILNHSNLDGGPFRC